MKKASRIILMLVLVCSVLCGCTRKFKQISVTSAELESAVPTSLHSAKATIAVGINNPAPSFKLKDIEATLKKNGEVFGLVTSEPLAIDGKCERIYHIPLQAQLSEEVGVIQLLAIYRNFRPEDFTLDLKARVNLAGGIGKNLEYNDVPLTKLLKK